MLPWARSFAAKRGMFSSASRGASPAPLPHSLEGLADARWAGLQGRAEALPGSCPGGTESPRWPRLAWGPRGIRPREGPPGARVLGEAAGGRAARWVPPPAPAPAPARRCPHSPCKSHLRGWGARDGSVSGRSRWPFPFSTGDGSQRHRAVWPGCPAGLGGGQGRFRRAVPSPLPGCRAHALLFLALCKC